MSEPATTAAEPTRVGAFEAKTNLSRLLRQARAGKRFIITQRGEPVAALGPLPGTGQSGNRKSLRGDMVGKIWIADDFCDELEELKEFFE